MTCLDLDGTLADTSATLRAHLCRVLDVDPSHVRIPTDYYAMHEAWPSEHHAVLPDLVRDAFASDAHGIYSQAEPYPYAARIVTILHGWNLLAGYVTRRPPATRDATRAWLEAHHFPPLPLHHAPHGVAKSVIVRELGAIGLIDDSPVDALEAANAGLRVALHAQPYNARVKHPRITRASTWAGLASSVLAWPELAKGAR